MGYDMSDFKVIKRDGREVPYDRSKIENAILGAAYDVYGEQAKCVSDWAESEEFKNLMSFIEDDIYGKSVSTTPRTLEFDVETIQDYVEDNLVYLAEKSHYIDAEVAKQYIKYRYDHELARQRKMEQDIDEVINDVSDYWSRENSNKDAKLVTTQRDYIAGIVSKNFARTKLFPKEVMEAHDKGATHYHDLDYSIENTLTNCSLVNLNDMLQNGTVLNGVMIERPHRISTATTIATQVILGVSSDQFGGVSVNLAHLAPFVRESHDRYLKKYQDFGLDEEQCEKLADIDTKKEVADAVQTFQYQVNSMTGTHGQAPFITLFMYLEDGGEYKPELAMLIEEVLKQRLAGMKNEQGVPVTVAFPKLIMVLDEDNITPDTPYWYLTELAAKCTAKRMVPDYISAKKMRELKLSAGEKPGEGDVFSCMGKRKL